MLLEDKNAVIYRAGGAVGTAVVRAFARGGVQEVLTGRTLDRVEAVDVALGADKKTYERCLAKVTGDES